MPLSCNPPVPFSWFVLKIVILEVSVPPVRRVTCPWFLHLPWWQLVWELQWEKGLVHCPPGKLTREKPPGMACVVRFGHQRHLVNSASALRVERNILESQAIPTSPVMASMLFLLIDKQKYVHVVSCAYTFDYDHR